MTEMIVGALFGAGILYLFLGKAGPVGTSKKSETVIKTGDPALDELLTDLRETYLEEQKAMRKNAVARILPSDPNRSQP